MTPELDTAAFPDDLETLRALPAQRDALIAERDAALAERDAELRNAGYEIEKLKVQLAALRHERYGRSSEKLAAEADQLEMLIGDLEENQAEREAAAAEKERRTKEKSGNQRKPATRRPLPEHLPRGSTHCVIGANLSSCWCPDLAEVAVSSSGPIEEAVPKVWSGAGQVGEAAWWPEQCGQQQVTHQPRQPPERDWPVLGVRLRGEKRGQC